MDSDRIKGKADEVAGRAKRQVGEWTGNEKTQAQGAAQEVKGKVQNTWGKTKDAVRDAVDDMKHNPDKADEERAEKEKAAKEKAAKEKAEKDKAAHQQDMNRKERNVA